MGYQTENTQNGFLSLGKRPRRCSVLRVQNFSGSDIKIQLHNTKYILEIYETAVGKYVFRLTIYLEKCT
jgi:hypothetical protein